MTRRRRWWLAAGLLLSGCAGQHSAALPTTHESAVEVRGRSGIVTTPQGSVASTTTAAVSAKTDAEEMLRKADEVRNPQLDYTLTARVTSIKPDAEPRQGTYEVLVKGRNLAVVKTLAPAIDRGRVLLMHGRDLWVFLPTVSKPLRISLRERLIGDVANGDLARANFSGDYTAVWVRQEVLEGIPHDVLRLTATAEDVTYGTVLLWIASSSFHPTRAEFYTISGRLLKTCSYERYQSLAGRLRPTRLVMRDALMKGQSSTIEYDGIEVGPLPDKYFTKDYMKKFME